MSELDLDGLASFGPPGAPRTELLDAVSPGSRLAWVTVEGWRQPQGDDASALWLVPDDPEACPELVFYAWFSSVSLANSAHNGRRDLVLRSLEGRSGTDRRLCFNDVGWEVTATRRFTADATGAVSEGAWEPTRSSCGGTEPVSPVGCPAEGPRLRVKTDGEYAAVQATPQDAAWWAGHEAHIAWRGDLGTDGVDDLVLQIGACADDEPCPRLVAEGCGGGRYVQRTDIGPHVGSLTVVPRTTQAPPQVQIGGVAVFPLPVPAPPPTPAP